MMRSLFIALLATTTIAHADVPYDRWRDALDPEPYVKPSTPPEAPDWCGGFTSQHKYPGGSFANVYLGIDRNTSTPTDAALAPLAEAACDYPPDHKNYQRRNAEVARARARWTALDGSSGADQKRYLRYFITHGQAQVAADNAELCKGPPSTSKNVFERFEDRARRDAFACDKINPFVSEPPFDSFQYWIDTPGYEPPALVRLQAAQNCLGRREASSAYCAYDVARVDLAAIDAEAATLNELGRLRIHFYAMVAKREIDRLAATKLPAETVAAAAKAAEDWQHVYAAQREEIDRAIAIQRTIYFDGLVPEAAVCDAARADLRVIYAASTAQTYEEALAIVSSPGNFLVAKGAAMCDAAADRAGLQAVSEGLTYEPRGVRMLAMRAVLGEQIARSFNVPWLNRPRWPRSVPGSWRARSRAAAVVGSVTRDGEFLAIKFAKETMPFEENYNCHDTGRISGIDDRGDIRYGVHCDTRMKALDVTPDPIRVLAIYGSGIRPGVLLRYAEVSKTLGFPTEVWSGPKKTKLEAINGFALALKKQ
jgi:hypothetical protein